MISEESAQERSRHHCSQPSSTLAETQQRKMAAWPLPRLSSLSDSGLFRITLVSTLWITVLGKCGPPPNLAFASPIKKESQEDYDTGTVLKYVCRLGYSRISSNLNVICRADGTWEYDKFCIKKRCRNPGDLPHGQVEIESDFSFGSQIRFSCLEGYILKGSPTSFCEIQDKGVGWSDSLPECVSVMCEPPPDISNGRHSGNNEDSFTYGSSVTYSCDPSFSLIGNASISCSLVSENEGAWIPDPPTCKKITCPPPDVLHGKIVSGFATIYTYKHSVMLTCQKGFVLVGNRVIRCEADGNWDSSPICERNSCLERPEIPRAYWTDSYTLRGDDIHYPGARLFYQCNSGYKPARNEPTNVICQRNFKWSAFQGCKKVCCPVPELQNVIRIQHTENHLDTGCTYFYEDVVSYSCNGGKQLAATCQADGTWHPGKPLCNHNCKLPPKVAHGKYELHTSFVSSQTSATYTCEEGYSLVGKATLTCGYLPWSPEAPECKAQCKKPQIEHGTILENKDQYVEPENITIRCDSGFSVVGPQSITCSENGTWYPKVPRCEWDVSEGCEQVLQGRKLMQCLPSAEEVKMALEIYKLSLEIELLELQRDKAKQSDLELSP